MKKEKEKGAKVTLKGFLLIWIQLCENKQTKMALKFKLTSKTQLISTFQ